MACCTLALIGEAVGALTCIEHGNLWAGAWAIVAMFWTYATIQVALP